MPERALAKRLLKKVNKAVHEYDLIGDGDRIVVAVSGGGDSLSLLRLRVVFFFLRHDWARGERYAE